MADEIVTFKPLGDKIIVRPDVRVLSSVILVNNKEAENMGTVVAVGPGKKLTADRREAMPIEVGAKVRFGTMSKDPKDEYLKFTPINHNGEKCLLMSWQDVCWVDGE
jgi:co-chaperonin GroES (HSP10)